MAFRDYAREVPLLGPLVDCDFRDHWQSLGQTAVVLVLSTAPIWLAAIVVFSTGTEISLAAFKSSLYGTVSRGELFMYCTALLAPMFWIALVDPPRARVFPSKVSHMLLIGIIDIIAAVLFGLGVAGNQLNQHFTFPLSIWMFIVSVILLYLGTVYHNSRLPDATTEFRKQEEEFTTEVREHRQ